MMNTRLLIMVVSQSATSVWWSRGSRAALSVCLVYGLYLFDIAKVRSLAQSPKSACYTSHYTSCYTLSSPNGPTIIAPAKICAICERDEPPSLPHPPYREGREGPYFFKRKTRSSQKTIRNILMERMPRRATDFTEPAHLIANLKTLRFCVPIAPASPALGRVGEGPLPRGGPRWCPSVYITDLTESPRHISI
jgi:hypothetical protein